MKKQLLILLLAIVTSIGIMNAEIHEGNCGDNLTWSLNTEDSTLTILGTGSMPTYIWYDPAPWSSYSDFVVHVSLPEGLTNIGQEAFNACQNLTAIELPNSVTDIEEGAFYGCSSLASVLLGNGVKTIVSNAFRDCISLTAIEIPSSVTSISALAFSGCSNLYRVTLNSDSIVGADDDNTSRINTTFGSQVKAYIIGDQVSSIGYRAFLNCEMETVTIGNGVTTIGKGAFENCANLMTVNILDFPLTTIGEWAFFSCNSLLSFYIPNNVTTIGEDAFYNVPNVSYDGSATGSPWGARSVNGYVDGYFVFSDATVSNLIACSAAASGEITMPNSVTSIGNNAFRECKAITSVDIPNNVTGIGEYAFYDCSYLTSVTIPESVSSIGFQAFHLCSKLSAITNYATTPQSITTNVFGQYVDKSSCTLYVPSESLDTYKSATGWSEFKNIRAIGDHSSNTGNTPLFPGDPGTLTLNLELKAAVIEGEEIQGYEPTGGGGYAKGSSMTITAQDIPGYEFVQWSDSVTDKSRTIELNESMTLTAYYTHSMIEIPVAANRWTFICLPPLGERQYTEEMFSYDGLTDVQWGTYNGAKRAAGQSGWETPETFNAMQGYIIYSATAGTLRINAYQDEIRQGESGNTIHAGMIDYASSHAQNANWNFVGNPYAQGYSIAGFAAAGITSPITVWNGVGYTTFTPGIDSYVLNPFEAFFIQKAENGAETLPFSEEYLEGNSGSHIAIEGELSGAFSIAEGRQIHFSRGNLQYQASTDTWRFAENQYDTIGYHNADISATNDGWIDLFGWGTGNNPTYSSTDDAAYRTYVDWGANAISNGGNETNLWRTLTNDEWGYLFLTRTNASHLYGQATVSGINGMIILPDDWQNKEGISFTYGTGDFSQNTYSSEQWSKMESSGAVFLPATGNRYSTNVVVVVNLDGYYWSSTPHGASTAYGLYFYSNNLDLQSSISCKFGLSVRLVR